jgi:ketosteroid isomerase-like protein
MKNKHNHFFFRADLLFAIVGQSIFGLAQSKELKEVKEVMLKEIEYWNHGDIDGYVSLYAPVDSVRMLYNGGAIYGKDNILAFYKKYWPKEKMGQLSFTEVKLERLSSEYYFASGYFHVIGPDGKKTDGRFSGLMKKIKGRWYLYTDHT